jgi:PKD repeat protein
VYRSKLSGRLLAPLCVMVLAAGFCVFSASAALATTYYVDSVSGNDNWNGQSPSTAWQTLSKVNSTTFEPGDEILFKAGCAWTGRLYPKGSGSDGSPIVIDMYAAGALPIINGNGQELEAVLLYNQEYWQINNLEVTNTLAEPGETRGIAIIGEDAGVLHQIHVKDCVVHDINGKRLVGEDKGKCNAGILVDVWGSSVLTHFDDILIEGNYVYTCDMSGIKVWNGAWYGWKCHERDYHTNVVLRNNVVDDIGGDGICPHMTIASLTEYNTAIRCRQRSEGAAYVAIWPYEADDAVVQYNEAYLTMGTKDGQGFDIDGVQNRCITQYNYSHDNDGGFILLCEEPGNACYYNDDAIVRYNISQNDGYARVFHLSGKVTDAQIYNNTIYVGAGTGDPNIFEFFKWKGTTPENTQLSNNIFYNLGTGDYDLSDSPNTVWDYNVFYGNHPAGEPDDPHKLTSDPKLVNPGSGGIGMDSVDGYQLQSDSPCRDSGVTIAGNGGQDYWGNTVPSGATDRGAHEYPGGGAPPVADFSGNPTEGDAPLTVYFTDLSTNAPTSWDWTFGDGGSSQAESPSHEYTTADTYTVSLEACNGAGCDTETKVDYITVTEPQAPVAQFSGEPLNGNAPLEVDFTDLSQNYPTAWDWSFGDSGTSQEQDPTHTYTSEAKYTVSLTAYNAQGDDTETKPDYINVGMGGGGDYFCNSMTIEVGTLVSGEYTDTHASDDVRVVIDAVKTSGKYSVYNVYTFDTDLSSVSSLVITNEAQYSELPSTGYHYRYVYAWNYSTSEWDRIERYRIYGAGGDETTTTPVPSPSDYMSGSGEVQVRITHGHMARDPWTLGVDHVKINAAP